MDDEAVNAKREEKYFIRPVLRVRDVAASTAYYCEKLGFNKVWEHGGDRPIIAEVEREELAVILDAGSSIPKPNGFSVITLSLHQPKTLGSIHKDLRDRGAKIVGDPRAVEWQENAVQFEVEDLDGNILVFWGENPR